MCCPNACPSKQGCKRQTSSNRQRQDAPVGAGSLFLRQPENSGVSWPRLAAVTNYSVTQCLFLWRFATFGGAGSSSVGFLTGNLLCLRGVSPLPRAHDFCYLLGTDETLSCYNLVPLAFPGTRIQLNWSKWQPYQLHGLWSRLQLWDWSNM